MYISNICIYNILIEDIELLVRTSNKEKLNKPLKNGRKFLWYIFNHETDPRKLKVRIAILFPLANEKKIVMHYLRLRNSSATSSSQHIT